MTGSVTPMPADRASSASTPGPVNGRLRIRPPGPSAAVTATLVALAGVRTGAIVLDLTPNGALVRTAAAAAGRTGVVVTAPPAALHEALASALRAGTVTNVFAVLPGARLLTALRPLLRPGARVALTAVTLEALHEACTVAAYDVLHVEEGVDSPDGVVLAAVRARQAV